MNPIRCVFKGSRDYLHSTTVFDCLLGEVGPDPKKIDFRFNLRTGRVCVLTTVKPPEEKPPVAIYTDARQTLYVVETGEAIQERVPYDEDGLGARFRLEGRTIHVPAGIGGHSFIECVVAAYKRLLISLVGKHRYAFVRMTLDQVPRGAFRVEYARQLSGGFYQGTIAENDKAVGRIFFGRWQ